MAKANPYAKMATKIKPIKSPKPAPVMAKPMKPILAKKKGK